jgi:hypothetical protein
MKELIMIKIGGGICCYIIYTYNLKNQQIIPENLPTDRLKNALKHYND